MKKLLIGLSLIWLMYFNMGSSCEGCGPFLTEINIGVVYRPNEIDTIRDMQITLVDLDLQDTFRYFPDYYEDDLIKEFGVHDRIHPTTKLELEILWNDLSFKDTIPILENDRTELYLYFSTKRECEISTGCEIVQVDSLQFYKFHESFQPGCE